MKVGRAKGVSHLLDICRTYYTVESGARQMCASKSVHAIRTSKGKPRQRQAQAPKPIGNCPNCIKQHEPGKANCPAKESKCNKCQRIGHWARKCRSGQQTHTQHDDKPKSYGGNRKNYHKKKTHALEMDEEEFELDELLIEDIRLDTVEMPSTEAFTSIRVPSSTTASGLQKVKVKVDTGAGGNVMPLRIFRQLHPEKIDSTGRPVGLTQVRTRMTAYNGGEIPLYGTLAAKTEWEPAHDEGTRHVKTRWYVADTAGPAILGLPSCNRLGVVTMNCSVEVRKTAPRAISGPIKTTEDLIKEYPDRFEGIGHFPGDYKIHLKEDAQPVIHPPRKCPIAIRPKVKAELDKMVELGVITPVDEPTDWVSSLAYAHKSNGDIRICLDPRDLNKNLRRDHHRVPTVEEVAHEFAGSKYFTKLDARWGYWSIVLEKESSSLTTFNSPFGRYRFLRLPFGLACSQDIFQKKMDQILEQAKGCISIADDITVHGPTEEQHDRHLRDLMDIARKNNVVFNPTKTFVKARSVNFFGCLYDENGVRPDPAKVTAIHAMDPPANITQLQQFLGMVQYLSPFIPGLSNLTAPLRQLQKKDVDFAWNPSYDAAFQKVKDAIESTTTLCYFDTTLPVTIQVDASQVGLGAVLLQEGKPVAFASKALTETEQRYANIEREMLAVVFGAAKFHTFVYGRPFTIESDHKPLEVISQKNLADTPARLQRMLLRIQGYNYTLRYRPGKEMLIADALSRYKPCAGREMKLDVAIHHVVSISDDRKEEYQQEFATNPEMKALTMLILDGWPEDIKDVPRAIRPYWQQRQSLSIEDGLILKGEALVIPPEQRNNVLVCLHRSHQGITKTTLLAKDSVFWPGYTKAIEEMVRQCETCLRFQPKNAATPLEPTPAPSRPWQMVATDIFTLEGHDYLVLGDFYSKMPLVRKYPSGQTNAGKTVQFLKEIFNEYGIPELIRSDNGRQYDCAQFSEFCKEWKIQHKTSSPTFSQSNGFAEAMVKQVKGALQRAKYSGTDPYLALLHLRATPIDAHLASPSELLNRRKLRTTIPSKISNTDPSADQARTRLDEKADKAKAGADQHARNLAPLYAGQPVAWYNTQRSLWFPATVVRKVQHNSYLIKTNEGAIYRRTRRHLRERHIAVKDQVNVEKKPFEFRPNPTWRLNLGQTCAPTSAAQLPSASPRPAEKESAKPADRPATPAKANNTPMLRRSSRASRPPDRLIEK